MILCRLVAKVGQGLATEGESKTGRLNLLQPDAPAALRVVCKQERELNYGQKTERARSRFIIHRDLRMIQQEEVYSSGSSSDQTL